MITAMVSRLVQVRLLARRGAHADAERLARTVVALAETTAALKQHGDARLDLAEALALAGRRDDAAEELERAIALYERKGCVAAVAQARERLAGSWVPDVGQGPVATSKMQLRLDSTAP